MAASLFYFYTEIGRSISKSLYVIQERYLNMLLDSGSLQTFLLVSSFKRHFTLMWH